jgi:cytochrome c biogenesis protein CcdA
MGSTTWRFARYYVGSPEYRRKGPPPMLLRLLGPIVVVLTVAVFATGIALLLGPQGWRSQMLLLHKASFVLWLAAMALHVLGHLLDTARLAPRDWYWRTRRQVRGAGLRQWAIATSLALGLVLGLLVVPRIGPWLASGHPGHA